MSRCASDGSSDPRGTGASPVGDVPDKTTLSSDHSVVFGVAANPHPRYSVGRQNTEGTVVIADSNREQIATAVKRPEVKRRMSRILAPEMVILGGKTLDFAGQLLEEPPEPSRSPGPHGQTFGKSPCSALASSRRKSSLPAAESASSCLSQRSCWSSQIHRATSANSSGLSCRIAPSISSTRLISTMVTNRVTFPVSDAGFAEGVLGVDQDALAGEVMLKVD